MRSCSASPARSARRAVELFASPVEAPEADRSYEILVDRSVGTGAAQSDAPKAAEPLAQPAPEPEPEPEPAAQPQKRAAPLVVRRATLRRAGRWARCELVLRLEAAHPLAPRSYTLVVTAIGAGGRATSERKRVTLR